MNTNALNITVGLMSSFGFILCADKDLLESYEVFGSALKIENGLHALSFSLEQEKAIDELSGIQKSHRYIIRSYEGDHIGAFRMVKLLNRWFLSWVFIRPTHRRKGIFSSIWNELKNTYGKIEVLPPYSEAMLSFLQKQENGPSAEELFSQEEYAPDAHNPEEQ